MFTRYPEPGSTKTRMIPALGSAGAAHLQRQMTLYTLNQTRSLLAQNLASVEVRFAGGSLAEMQQWLGTDLNYQPQPEGGLGDRLSQSFTAAFHAGATHVITIGTDCPGLTAERLQQAFLALQQHDLVLGPAEDGGYYLIGLQRPIPELFVGINWGTDVVLQQTGAIAQSLNLSVALLDPLADVDRPEDLPIWEAVRSQLISVIMPVRNEAHLIREAIQHVRQLAPTAELIVVDGGSQDDTPAIARSCGALVLDSPPGRAQQMNRGAAEAAGELLLFLHADTRLPPNFPQIAQQTLAIHHAIAGAFELEIDGTLPGLRLVEWGVRWRSRFFQLPYGDQAIFLRASTFKQLGGFAELPIMEDFELIQRLKRRGKVAIAPAAVLTSSRRWKKLGVWRTFWINQIVILAYFLGIAPEHIAQWYRGNQTSKPQNQP